MQKSVVRTSVHTLTGGILTYRAFGFVAFLSWWVTVVGWLEGHR
jgi:tetrahydromethanopterin S-methyltransferase subunit E